MQRVQAGNKVTLTIEQLDELGKWSGLFPLITRPIWNLSNGKPEPLKHKLQDSWSRRITQEHRLVYCVTNTETQVIACKYHYC